MGRTIYEIKVVDVEKRKIPSKHYVYMIYVTWSDGSTNIIYRRYSRFFDFQSKIIEMFPEEAGSLDPSQRIIPLLPGKKFFGRSHVREVAVKRLGPISDYCKALVELPEKISQCKDVLEFFELEPDDIDPPKGRKKASIKANKISEPKPLEHYIAVADYKKQEKGEVTLKVDMLVEVIEKTESGWWFVNVEDEQGWVPSTCLVREDGVKESSSTIFRAGEEEQYLCTEEFKPQSSDEIAMERGAVVDVVEKNLEGWWLVRYNGKEGYVPATYLIKSDAFRMKKQKLVQRTGGPQIIKSLHEVSDLLQEKQETASDDEEEEWEEEPIYTIHEISKILREDKRGELETDKIYETIAKQHSLKRGGSVRPPPRPAVGPKKKTTEVQKAKQLTRTNSLSRVYNTIADFSDSVGDGISFQAGESVKVLEKAEGGWWYIQLQDKEGWAPASYIEEVSSEKNLTIERDKVPALVEEEESAPEPASSRGSNISQPGTKPSVLENALKGRMNVPPPQPPKKTTAPDTKGDNTLKPTPPPPPQKVRSSSPVTSRNSETVNKGPLPLVPKKNASSDSKLEAFKVKPQPPPPAVKSSDTDTRKSGDSSVKPTLGAPIKPGQKPSQFPPAPPAKKIQSEEPTSKPNLNGKPAGGIANALKAKFESGPGPGPTPVKPAVSDNKPNSNKPSSANTGNRLFEKAKPAAATNNKPAWMQKHADHSPRSDSAAGDESRKSVSDLANVLKSKFENRQKITDEKGDTDVENDSNTSKSNLRGPALLPPKKDGRLSPKPPGAKPSRPVTPPMPRPAKQQNLDPHKYSARPLPPQPGGKVVNKNDPPQKPLPSLPMKPGKQSSPVTSTAGKVGRLNFQKLTATDSNSSDEESRPAGVAGLASALKAKLEGNKAQAGKPENTRPRPKGPGVSQKPAINKPSSNQVKSDVNNSKITPKTVANLNNNNKTKENENNGQLCKVVADFEGENEGEMSLTAGKTVTVLEKSEDWWYVKDGIQEGWAPALYLEEISSSLSSNNKRDESPVRGNENYPVFRACAPFLGEQEGEVTFSDGQEVMVVDQPEGGWWYIKIGNDEGWAPSSYLEEIS